MAVIIHWIATSGYGINSVDVIDISISIVIDVVSRSFVGIAPHVAC